MYGWPHALEVLFINHETNLIQEFCFWIPPVWSLCIAFGPLGFEMPEQDCWDGIASGFCLTTVSFRLRICDSRKGAVIINPFCCGVAFAISWCNMGRSRWLSWMRRSTGDQEVAGSTPAEVDNSLSWRLIMKYFLRSFSPFRWFKKGSCQFLAKECAQYWLTA